MGLPQISRRAFHAGVLASGGAGLLLPGTVAGAREQSADDRVLGAARACAGCKSFRGTTRGMRMSRAVRSTRFRGESSSGSGSTSRCTRTSAPSTREILLVFPTWSCRERSRRSR